MRLIETTIAVNDQRKKAMAQRIIKACGGSVKNKTIAILGLTFKPNTDDMREAPSRVLLAELVQRGAQVRAYDPVAREEAARVLALDLGCEPEQAGIALVNSATDLRTWSCQISVAPGL